MVDLQIENGANGLIIGGTTGEGHLMSWDEHIMLIAHTAKEFGKQILVIGNTGDLMLDNIQHDWKSYGTRSLLLISASGDFKKDQSSLSSLRENCARSNATKHSCGLMCKHILYTQPDPASLCQR